MEASDNFRKQPKDIFINNAFLQNVRKKYMVYRGEKLPDIAFEYPTSFCIISTDFTCKCLKSFQGFMRPFTITARIRIGDECCIEKRIQDTVQGVMHQPVPHQSFVDVSWFGIGDFEGAIPAMSVAFHGKLSVERKNIVRQI